MIQLPKTVTSFLPGVIIEVPLPKVFVKLLDCEVFEEGLSLVLVFTVP